MTKHTTIYPLSAVRTLALHAQGLAKGTTGASSPAAPEAIYEAVDRIGCVQIDTLQLVQRSHYLALWSRLGCYNPADFDRVAYGDPGQNNRRLFEYWLKEACYIPLTEYRYRLPLMRFHREGGHRWSVAWAQEHQNAEMITQVAARIQADGALRSADFEHNGKRPGSWWSWKPAKHALEYLYNRGELMIANRVNFQRVYDLRERVLPDWVDTAEPTHEETIRHMLIRAAGALGVCSPLQTADYVRIKRTEAGPFVDQLIEEGVFVPIQARLADDKLYSLIVPRENLPLLEQAADGTLGAERTTFLSPFDNLFWAKQRDMQLWNFQQTLEAYKPEPTRKWGYYCLPILHRERFVGRFDPKLERKAGLLRLKALYLEPGVAPDATLVADVAGAMRDFMTFHRAKDLAIERSEPKAFGKKLLQAM
jgi:uncharacterized protein YcaQ